MCIYDIYIYIYKLTTNTFFYDIFFHLALGKKEKVLDLNWKHNLKGCF